MVARVIAFGLILAAMPAFAASAPGGRCCAAKLRATGAREKQLFRCWAQAAVRGTATADPACVVAAGSGLARQFTRAEDAGGCAGVGDAGRVQTDIERLASEVATLLRPTSSVSLCAARKLKHAGRVATSLARAFGDHAPNPADHLGAIELVVAALGEQIAAKYTQIEVHLTCLTTGDAGAVVQRLASGVGAPAAPDGMLLASGRLCPSCGDDVQGGGEQCDGADATSCNGPCQPGCVCPTCGDGVKDQPSEACDGSDAAACPGLCQADCTCPAPVCGNGIVENGEQCDGSCLYQGVEAGLTCTASCNCCGLYDCYYAGCCDPETYCLHQPGYHPCWKVRCDIDPDCGPGYSCVDATALFGGKACLPLLGSVCYLPSATESLFLPCATPGTTCGSNFRCCYPAGHACNGGDCCPGLNCTGGTCG